MAMFTATFISYHLRTLPIAQAWQTPAKGRSLGPFSTVALFSFPTSRYTSIKTNLGRRRSSFSSYVSEASLKSRYVNHEIGMASQRSKGCTVVPSSFRRTTDGDCTPSRRIYCGAEG